MIRHCDGTDPNLIMVVEDEEHPTMERRVPCKCGLTFDDVKRMTIFPHHNV